MYVKRMQEDLIRLQMQEDGDSEEIQAKILQSLMTGEGKMDERDRAMQLEKMMQSMRTNDNSDENIMFHNELPALRLAEPALTQNFKFRANNRKARRLNVIWCRRQSKGMLIRHNGKQPRHPRKSNGSKPFNRCMRFHRDSIHAKSYRLKVKSYTL